MVEKNCDVLAALRIKFLGAGCDARTGLIYRLYEFNDLFDTARKLLFAAGKYKDREGELVNQLDRAGCPLPMSRKKLNAMIATLDTHPSDITFDVTSQVGWFGDKDEVFCTPLQAYGKPTRPLETDLGAISANHKFRPRGTLKLWKKRVARKARGNCVMMFALASPFAGPLLKLLGIESGGFQLVGTSSSGKTTCLTVAGSVWGVVRMASSSRG
ncbi:DUF927 domain-containing protein [Azospirillum argentinense]